MWAEVEREYAEFEATKPLPARARERTPWLTADLWRVIELKHAAYHKWRNATTPADRQRAKEVYDERNRAAKRAVRKRRADFWEQFAADLERNAQLGNAGEAHRMLRTLYKPRIKAVPHSDQEREACATHFATLFAPLSAEQEAARAANPPLATPPAPRPRTRAATEQRRCVTAAICGGATAADRQHPGRASYAVHFPNGEYPDVTERAWGPQSTARGEICALLHCLEMTKASRDDLHLVVGATGIPGNLRRITDLAEGDFGDVDHADLWRDVARLILEGERRVTCTRRPRRHTGATTAAATTSKCPTTSSCP